LPAPAALHITIIGKARPKIAMVFVAGPAGIFISRES
jgi:hypothetical protein